MTVRIPRFAASSQYAVLPAPSAPLGVPVAPGPGAFVSLGVNAVLGLILWESRRHDQRFAEALPSVRQPPQPPQQLLGDQIKQLQLLIDDLQQKIRIARFNNDGEELISMWQGMLAALEYLMIQMDKTAPASFSARTDVVPPVVNAEEGGGSEAAGSTSGASADDAPTGADTDPESLLVKLVKEFEPGTVEHDLVAALELIQIGLEPALLLTTPLHKLVVKNLAAHNYTLLGALSIFSDVLRHWGRVTQCVHGSPYPLMLNFSIREDVAQLLGHQSAIEREAVRQFGAPIAEMGGQVAVTLSIAAGTLFMTENSLVDHTIAALLLHHARRRFAIIGATAPQMDIIRTFADLKKASDLSVTQDAIYSRIWGDVVALGEEGVWELLDFVERSGDGLATYAIHVSLSYFYRSLGFGQVADDHESVAKDAGNEAIAVGSMELDAARRMEKKIRTRALRTAEENGLSSPKARTEGID